MVLPVIQISRRTGQYLALFLTITFLADSLLQVMARIISLTRICDGSRRKCSILGLNTTLLKGKLDLSIDWYNTNTTDLLLYVSIAQSTGFSSVLLNSGALTNKGMDFEVSYKVINNNKFKWDIGGNISFVRNKITDLAQSTPYFASSPSGHLGIDGSWVEAGNPIGVWRGYEYTGLFQNDSEAASFSAKAGYPKYTDVNKDGKYTSDDYKIIGNPNPKYMFGVNTSFKYANFDLGIFFRGVQGNQVRNLAAIRNWGMACRR